MSQNMIWMLWEQQINYGLDSAYQQPLQSRHLVLWDCSHLKLYALLLQLWLSLPFWGDDQSFFSFGGVNYCGYFSVVRTRIGEGIFVEERLGCFGPMNFWVGVYL